MVCYAHLKRNQNHEVISTQTLKEHSVNAARIATQCVQGTNIESLAYLSALCHDMGKAKDEFQQYLLGNSGGRGSVIHTFAGPRFFLERLHDIDEDYNAALTTELIAYAIGAHHGLFDCIDTHKNQGFSYRKEKKGTFFQECKNNFFNECCSLDEIDRAYDKAVAQISSMHELLLNMACELKDSEKIIEVYFFYLGMLSRLILSAVIEGDRRDTANFDNSDSIEHQDESVVDWSKVLQTVEDKIKVFPKEQPIQQARAKISDLCRMAAEEPVGVKRLNVPTGGGKTLSALRYAVAHAKKWDKKRVIFVTPLLSILDQNAKVIREYVGDNRLILEHHSNVIQERKIIENLQGGQKVSETEELDKRELSMENWHAPIIITTMAQLLNTMFLGKTSAIRRFQALNDAVIVIDEVQTIPSKMISLFNLAVNFLAKVCNASFLLCSATQPCFEETNYPMIAQIDDVVPYNEKLWKPFQRTKLIDQGKMGLEEIADFAENVLEGVDSLLIVCNKKQQADKLFQFLKNSTARCFYLSSSMCVAHRRVTIDSLREALDTLDEKVVCVSTQVIEAGVDISFQTVIRLAAGMDSVVQAAGRCNRNGENKDTQASVYLIECLDEKLHFLKDIELGKRTTCELKNAFSKDASIFDSDLMSDKSISHYYKKLYAKHTKEDENYPIKIEGKKNTIFSLLSINGMYAGEENGNDYILNQAFKTAGDRFEVYDQPTIDVVVEYQDSIKLIEDLVKQGDYVTVEYMTKWNRQIKPYTIALFDYQLANIKNFLRNVQGVIILSSTAYSQEVGFEPKIDDRLLEV